MRHVVLRGLATRKLRSALTAIAIMLGVAMISGTFALTDQLSTAFEDVFLKTRADTSVVVTKPAEFSSDQTGDIVPFDVTALDAVKAVDGVAIAVPVVQGLGGIVVNGEYKGATGGAPPLVFSASPKPFDAGAIYLEGGPPTQNGEISILESMADGVAIGDTVQMATDQSAEPVKVVGIFKSDVDFGGASVTIGTYDDVSRWFRLEGKAQEIDVAATDGVSDEELRDRVADALQGTGLQAQTGRERGLAEAKQISDGINTFLRPALLAFAAIAVLVGAFIIFNTFSITVGQRIRELAMLRTLGASRKQIQRSVLAEALVIAVIATILGLIGGLLFAKALNVLFDSLGFGLPQAGLTLAPRTIVWSLVVGIGITLAAAYGPARRATRIPPVAALQEGAELPRTLLSRLGPFLAPLFAVLGIALVAWGFFGSMATTQRLGTMGGGVLVTMVGVAMVSKWLVPPIARAIGLPLEKVTGLPGRIARENAMRNPGRTAVTSAALMIGVALITFVGIFAAGLKSTFEDQIGKTFTSEMLIQSRSFGFMPPAVVPAVEKVQGVAEVVPVRTAQVKVDGSEESLIAAPDNLPAAYTFDWVKGDDDLVGQLGEDGALVEQDWAQGKGLAVGDTLAVTTQEGAKASFKIVGEYKDSTFFSGFMVGVPAYQKLVDTEQLGIAFIKFQDGADGATVEQGVKDVVKAEFPQLQAQSNREALDEAKGQINQLLAILYGLLAMAVVISIFGIVNTLILSVYERTREIGLMRAVGTTRRQLRRIIRYESVITSVIGAVLGIALGIVFGALGTQAIEGLGFTLPVGQLVIFLVASIIAGVLAAIAPARRAARLNVLEALQYE